MYLYRNEITFSGVSVLARALSARPLSTAIDLHSNSLTDGQGCTLRLRPMDEVDEFLLHTSNRQTPLPASGSGSGGGGGGAIKFTVTGADDNKQREQMWAAANGSGLAQADSKTSLASSGGGGGGGGAALKTGCFITFESKLDRVRQRAANFFHSGFSPDRVVSFVSCSFRLCCV